ncbi:hypothetical protein SLA2020_067710 [Shorea laevis]
MSDEGAPSRWMFFQRLDQLIGPSAKGAFNAVGGGGASGGSGSKVPIGISVGICSQGIIFMLPRFQNQDNNSNKTRGLL